MKHPNSHLAVGFKKPVHRPFTECSSDAALDPLTANQLADIEARARVTSAPRRLTEPSKSRQDITTVA